MATDPYGFESDPPVERAPGQVGSYLAGCTLVATALPSLGWIALCGGFMHYDYDGTDLAIYACIFLIFTLPSFLGLGITAMTIFAAGLTRRWWVFVAPNVVGGLILGGVTWFVLFISIFFVAVLRDM